MMRLRNIFHWTMRHLGPRECATTLIGCSRRQFNGASCHALCRLGGGGFSCSWKKTRFPAVQVVTLLEDDRCSSSDPAAYLHGRDLGLQSITPSKSG